MVKSLTGADNIPDLLSSHSSKLADTMKNQGDLLQLNTNDKSTLVNALKEIKSQANTNTSNINGINAGPKGVYATSTALQTAFPLGNSNTYVVTADGGWYYWNGSSWTKGGTYQSSGIGSKSIQKNMLVDDINNVLPVSYPTISSYPAISFTDDEGKRSWIEADESGKPTDHTIGLLNQSIPLPSSNSIPNIAFALIDDNEQISDLEIGADGHFTDRVVNLLAARLVTSMENLSKSDLHNFSCWGESTTEGGSSGDPYPLALSKLINNPNVNVNNLGISGQCSGLISARMGSNIVTITGISGGSIPATTAPVNVTMTCSTGHLHNFQNGSFACTINGVPGTLTLQDKTTGAATFIRTTAGTQVSVTVPIQAVSSQLGHENDLSIVWIGRNDISFAWPYQTSGVISNLQGMINYLKPSVKRFLILTVTNGSGEDKTTQNYADIENTNNQIMQLYPENYFDVRRYLIDHCLQDAGITPTSQDLQDISNDIVPTSLRADSLHPNDIAREQIAKQIYKLLNMKGWIL